MVEQKYAESLQNCRDMRNVVNSAERRGREEGLTMEEIESI